MSAGSVELEFEEEADEKAKQKKDRSDSDSEEGEPRRSLRPYSPEEPTPLEGGVPKGREEREDASTSSAESDSST